MAVTQGTISSWLVGKGYPCSLTGDIVPTIIEDALKELNAHVPSTRISSFPTVKDSQNYAIFNPEDPAYISDSIVSISAVRWSPGGDTDPLNVFAPNLFDTFLMTGSELFELPTAMTVFRQKLNAFDRHFGEQGFSILGHLNDAASYLQIYPVPPSTGLTVVVEWSTPIGLEDITTLNLGVGRWLGDWLEVFACEALANKHALTAGTEIAGFKDSRVAYDHFMKRSVAVRQRAESVQGCGASGGLIGVA